MNHVRSDWKRRRLNSRSQNKQPKLGIWRAVGCGIPFVLSTGVFAQNSVGIEPTSSSANRNIILVPRVMVTETLTDNVNLSSIGSRGEMVTEVSPGIRISKSAGRVRGILDYSLNGRTFTNGTSANNIQQALTAQASAELLEGRAFVDVGAGVAQQAVSVGGLQSSAAGVQNSNLSETTNFRVAPYLKGTFGAGIDYEARYALARSGSRNVASADSTSKDITFSIAGRPLGAKLGWSANASSSSNSFAVGRTTESSLVTSGVSYAITPQLVANLALGQESTNVTTTANVVNWTNSWGFNWNPSPSTTASLSRSVRPFGETHSLSISRRSAKTVWQFSDTQDVSVTPSQQGFGSLGNVYDLYFAQFASIEPDLIKRAALVEAYLQTSGISPKTSVIGSFFTSAVATQRRQNLSMALLGVRSTVTLLASRSVSSRLDTVSTAIDDLSNGSLVEQNGFSINLGHRLTPMSAVNMIVSTQRSTSTGVALDNALFQTSLGLTTRIGQRATASFSARRAIFESSTVPYQENAVSGTLSVQF